MGSTLSLFPQSNSNPFSTRKNPRSETSKEEELERKNPRSETSKEEELEQLYKLMKAIERRENTTAQPTAEDLQKLMDHWYKLEKNTRSQTAQGMLEHFYKLMKEVENEENRSRMWKLHPCDEDDYFDWERWYKAVAVSECNEKFLVFGMKCGWLQVDSSTQEIMRRKRDLWNCGCAAFSFYRCLKQLDYKNENNPSLPDGLPIDGFKEP